MIIPAIKATPGIRVPKIIAKLLFSSSGDFLTYVSMVSIDFSYSDGKGISSLTADYTRVLFVEHLP